MFLFRVMFRVLRRRDGSVVEHSYANPKVPCSIPSPLSCGGLGLRSGVFLVLNMHELVHNYPNVVDV